MISLELLNDQTKAARGSDGLRYVRCEICGLVSTTNEFVSYGGLNHINLGICRSCMTKRDEEMRPLRERYKDFEYPKVKIPISVLKEWEKNKNIEENQQ